VLGVWEAIPDKGEEPKQNNLERRAYFPGYPIKIGGVSCVQLQAIGTDDGPPKKDEKDLFHVVSHRLAGAGLEIKILNTELVDDDLKTTDPLT